MLKTVIISFFKGSTKTKKYLWSIFALSLFAIVDIIIAIITSSAYLYILAFLSLFIAFVIFKSVSFSTIISEQNELIASNEQLASKNASDELVKEAASIDEPHSSSLKYYDKKALKTYFHKYKVKKEHFPILIDSSKKYDIKQAPGFIWKDKKGVHILVLEEIPRKLTFTHSEFAKLFYVQGVSANPDTDYEEITKNAFVNMIFSDLFPECTREVFKGKYIYKKNLYGIGEDILITAQSARLIMAPLLLSFEISPMYISTSNYSTFFERATKVKILWQDKVLGSQEYKARIRTILNNLALADLTVSEYLDELDKMVRRSLITNDYATYYKEHRQEIRKKPSR